MPVISATPSPDIAPIETQLHRLYSNLVHEDAGSLPAYHPILAQADRRQFGICIATMDGHVYEVGDVQAAFSMQSISNALVYGIALEDRGIEAVMSKVGVEPTGDAFNEISLDRKTGCPLNPMINAGAIATASLVAGETVAQRFERVLRVFSSYAGRALEIDEKVYWAERETGHRNRAIGHMLRNFGVLDKDPGEALDLYFRQCAIRVTCRDLALMAATLANDGAHPMTEERAIPSDLLRHVLSVMSTCGMYDYSGQWMYSVGMPAKSGIGGGIMAVLPGQFGIGVYSPALDERGNSVRGVAVCQALSEYFGLHMLSTPPRAVHSAVRHEYSVARVPSKRVRSRAQGQWLREVGRHGYVFEIQGDYVSASAESATRRILRHGNNLSVIMLDLRRLVTMDKAAQDMMRDLGLLLLREGREIACANGKRHLRILVQLKEHFARAGFPDALPHFSNIDVALEWCEERLLARYPMPAQPEAPSSLMGHEVCEGLELENIQILQSHMQLKTYAAGEVIVRKGDTAAELFLLVSGQVSIKLASASGEPVRLATITSGMLFGELALAQELTRIADVYADTEVEIYVLTRKSLAQIGQRYPQIELRLIENVMQKLARTIAAQNGEILALSA